MTHLRSSYNYIWYIGVGLMLLALLAGFVPQHEGSYLRRHVSTTIAKLAPEDMPKPITNSASWSMRAPVNFQIVSSSQTLKHNNPATNLLNFNQGNITINTTHGKKNVEVNANFKTIMASWHTENNLHRNTLRSALPPHYGEALNIDGQPLRWANNKATDDNDARSCALQQGTLKKTYALLSARIAKPPSNESTLQKARRYKNLVQSAAKRYNLNEFLLYAIIQTESNFSPALVSSQSAMGLMQLLPSTAGGEVHKYLHGYTTTMTLADLAQPHINILFGATYMHLLLTRHLGEIKDPKSRQYCALAAYNMGPGRLIRFFGNNRDEAINNINKLTASEVYFKLTTVLPIAETRAYVSRVTTRQVQFEGAL